MEQSIPNTALVLEGGGFRAMFTSGVLDSFLKNKLFLPYCIGVSAGAAYGISYVTRQYERNRKVNLEYTSDPRYMSWGNLFRKGNLFDWDFVYGEIPKRLIPLDYAQMAKSDTQFYVGMTDVQSGKSEYVHANHLNGDDLMSVVTASSSLPFVTKMARFNNKLYMDGGISDSIPIRMALDNGFDKAIVVLTRNEDYRKKASRLTALVKLKYWRYPKLVEAILTRFKRYNESLELISSLEKQGKVFVIRPQETIQVSRIENNPEKLDELYLQGVRETDALITRLKEWM